MEAIAINRVSRLILMDSDEVVEMDTLFDLDGDETDDPQMACVAIAELPDGSWIAVNLDEFESSGEH